MKLSSPCRRCGAREAESAEPRGAPSGVLAEAFRLAREGSCEECWRAWLRFSVKWLNERRADLREPAVAEAYAGELERFLRLRGARDPWARFLDARVVVERVGEGPLEGTVVGLDAQSLELALEERAGAGSVRLERDRVLTLRLRSW